jgi:hypothetical protein
VVQTPREPWEYAMPGEQGTGWMRM